MNREQRSHFVKRVNEIHARRKEEICKHFSSVHDNIKSELDRLNEWYANASAKEIQSTAEDLLSTMMERLNTKDSYACRFRFPSVEEALVKDCAMPIMAKIVLDRQKEVHSMYEQRAKCLEAENAHMEKLIDSVMFEGDAAKLIKLLQKYQNQKLPFKN